jgi:hypothetical protein
MSHLVPAAAAASGAGLGVAAVDVHDGVRVGRATDAHGAARLDARHLGSRYLGICASARRCVAAWLELGGDHRCG